MSISLSKLANTIGDSPTLKINAKARALKAAGEPVIHLGGGEPTYPAPQAAVDGLVKKVSALAQKYAVTMTDLDTEIARTEREFSVMLEQLTGSASDMAGLAELRKLLGGA